MSVLEELWHGNILPNAHTIQEDGPYYPTLQKISAAREELLSQLSPEQKSLAENLLDLQQLSASFAEKDAFIKGFCLAVRIMAESFSA